VDASETPNLEAIRARAQEVIQRAERDENFRNTLREHYLQTLAEAGLGRDELQQLHAQPERAAEADIKCVDTTCWVTQCPDSCYITVM